MPRIPSKILAYLAGAIDSDGTIGVRKSTYSMRIRGDSAAPVYSEKIALRQVTPEIPDLLKMVFGGSLYSMKPSVPNGRPLWSWAITDQKAAAAAKQLIPYLRIKKAQAENLLALRSVKTKSLASRMRKGRGHVGGASRLAEHGDQMENLFQFAKSLNLVGLKKSSI